MADDQLLLASFSEEQQEKVYQLMALANVDDINFASQMLMNFEFDLEKTAKTLLEMDNVNKPKET